MMGGLRNSGMRISIALIVISVSIMVLALQRSNQVYAGQSSPEPASAVQLVNSECGACHMVYPPQFLPARSWRAIMAGLNKHFGEIASLDAATARRIEDFLMSNAADTVNGEAEFLRGLGPTDTPLRITDTPLWRAIHPKLLRSGVGTGPGIRSAANCMSCHKGTEEDD
jgi:hypothetical protein